MIRLIKTCESCGTKSIIEIDLEKRIVRIATLWGGLNPKDFGIADEHVWISYSITRPLHADHLIYAATRNGYLVE